MLTVSHRNLPYLMAKLRLSDRERGSGLRAPTMATSTAALARVQATSSWTTAWPLSSANFCNSLTFWRFPRKLSSLKSSLPLPPSSPL